MTQRLAGEVLLVLQLRARGYSEAQIVALTRRAPAEVRTLLSAAAAALGAADGDAAITEARRRGLIA